MDEDMILVEINNFLQDQLQIGNEVDGSEEISDLMSEYDLSQRQIVRLASSLRGQFQINLSAKEIMDAETISDVVSLILDQES